MADDFLNALLSGGINGAGAGITNSLLGNKTNTSLAALLNAQDLQSFQQEAQQNNIFNQIAPAIAGTKFDRSGWGIGQNLGVSAGQAFLSGLMSNYGKSQVADQVAKVSSILPELYKDPTNVVFPEGLDISATNNLRTTALVKKAQQEALLQQSQDSLIQDIFGKGQTAKAEAFGKFAGEKEAKTLYSNSANSQLGATQETAENKTKAEQIYSSAYFKAINDDMEPAAAREIASLAAAPYAQLSKELTTSSLAQIDKTQRASSLLSGIDQTIENAGNTGLFGYSAIGGAIQKVISNFDGEDSSADRTVQGRQDLDNLKGAAVSLFREVGEGQVSDADALRFVARLPSRDKTKAENKKAAATMERTLEEGLDFARAKAQAAKSGNLDSILEKAATQSNVMTRLLSDGTSVKVIKLPNGQFQEVE